MRSSIFGVSCWFFAMAPNTAPALPWSKKSRCQHQRKSPA
jgi:hypothetical protein